MVCCKECLTNGKTFGSNVVAAGSEYQSKILSSTIFYEIKNKCKLIKLPVVENKQNIFKWLTLIFYLFC